MCSCNIFITGILIVQYYDRTQIAKYNKGFLMIMNKEEDSHFNLLTRYSHYYVPVQILKVKQMLTCLNVLTL